MPTKDDFKIKVYKRANCRSEFEYTGVTYVPNGTELLPSNYNEDYVMDDDIYKFVFFSRDREMGRWTSEENDLPDMGYPSYLESLP